MDVPDLVRDSLGDEAVEERVNLGDEDTICLTPTRTLLYRAEGLLSDEKIQEFPHDVERLDVSAGRRKTKFELEYVDGTRTFSVPGNRDDQVLELVLQGVLRAADVAAADESVVGAFRFSELTLVITDRRVVKHIGSVVWTDDFEEYAFDDVTGLSFERGSVATEVVIEVAGRPQRIKTPNDRARKVQQVLENAIFAYHDVDSLEQLNRELAVDGADAGADESGDDADDDLTLGGGLDPLVTEDEDEGEDDGAPETAAIDRVATGEDETDGDETASKDRTPTDAASESAASAAELAAVEQQLDELTTAVARQNELLKKQHRTIKQLIKELREGR